MNGMACETLFRKCVPHANHCSPKEADPHRRGIARACTGIFLRDVSVSDHEVSGSGVLFGC